MYFYAARQPILDRDKKLFAYELLFRDSLDNVFPGIDGDEATSRIIEGSQLNFGLEDLTSNKPAFINFTLETMSKGYPTFLTPQQLVVEVLETVQPGKRLLQLCKELHEQGYVLALDDYEHQAVWRHFYPFIQIIKIDVLATDKTTIEQIITDIKDFPHIKLLAEKVETPEQFQYAFDLGFSYFQGFFFAKPEVVKSKNLSPSQMTLAELLYQTSMAEMDLRKITEVFERDVNLSYKLLRYTNSAAFKRRTEINTIKQALVVLGQAELKKFLSVLFTSQVASDKPRELMYMSLIRARFSEQLAVKHFKIKDTGMAFLTGMLSLIDAILDQPLEDVMKKLPLSQEIKDALTKQEGLLAEYIRLVQEYEKADWNATNADIQSLGIQHDYLPDLYADAVSWANEQMANLED